MPNGFGWLMFHTVTFEITQKKRVEADFISAANSTHVELSEEIICGRARRISASQRSHAMFIGIFSFPREHHKHSSCQEWSKPHE